MQNAVQNGTPDDERGEEQVNDAAIALQGLEDSTSLHRKRALLASSTREKDNINAMRDEDELFRRNQIVRQSQGRLDSR